MARRKTDIQYQVTFPLSGEYQRFEQLILSDNLKDYEEAFKMLKNKMDLRNARWSKTAQGGEAL